MGYGRRCLGKKFDILNECERLCCMGVRDVRDFVGSVAAVKSVIRAWKSHRRSSHKLGVVASAVSRCFCLVIIRLTESSLR